MDRFRSDLRRNGLSRPRQDRVLGGVCAGIGRRFGIDPWPARLLFLAALMVLPGCQFLIYPILWFMMPRDDAPVAEVPYAAAT